MKSGSLFALLVPCVLSAAAPSLPLRFEANVGQLHPSVKFHARSAAYQLFLTESESVVALRTGAVRMSLAGANAHPVMEGVDEFAARATFLTGRDKSLWKEGVSQFAKVRYKGVYPGIDVLYYGKDRSVEHDFIVAPGADISRIRLKFSGATPRIAANGDLLLTDELTQHKPVAMQDGREVAARYVQRGSEIGFQLGAYDRKRPLVIDPVLAYSTLLGGSDTDTIRAITVDSDGSVWVAGSTISTNFPLAGDSTKDAALGATDILVAKLNLNATGRDALLFTTYLGGSGNDEARAIAFRQGNLYIAGVTFSDDFPALGTVAQVNRKGEGDAFVVYLNTSAPGKEALWFSTFLGGTKTDIANSMVVTDGNNVYVAGTTLSDDFPTTGSPFQTASRGGQEGFFFLVNAATPPGGQPLVYSTYIGGSSSDTASGVAVGPAGEVYLTGFTASGDFPISSGIQDRQLRGDAYIARVDVGKQGLNGLIYADYVGGTGLDVGTTITLSSRWGVCVGGYSLSTDFATTNGAPQKENRGAADAFVSCYDLSTPGFGNLTYSTLLGGEQDDVLYSLISDAQGRLYATGYTISRNFPLKDALQVGNGGFMDAFLTRIDTDGSLGYSGYYGGSMTDVGYGLALDAAGNVLMGGMSISPSPALTPNAVQNQQAGRGDSFVARFNLNQ